MTRIATAYADTVRYTLRGETQGSLVIQEPMGWKEEGIEIARHEKYHGVFVSFTGKLGFTGEAKSYILNDFGAIGLNSKLKLTKEVLGMYEGKEQFIPQYISYIDYNTMSIYEDFLQVNFNGNDITEVIKSYETDTFEIERLQDVNDNSIEAMPDYNFYCAGRDLFLANESDLSEPDQVFDGASDAREEQEVTPFTVIVSEPYDRFEAVATTSGITDSSFIVRSTSINDPDARANIYVNGRFRARPSSGWSWDQEIDAYPEVYLVISVYEYTSNTPDGIPTDDTDNDYTLVESIPVTSVFLQDIDGGDGAVHPFLDVDVDFSVDDVVFQWNYSLVLEYRLWGAGITVNTQNLKVNLSEDFEASSSLRFTFVYNAFERLVEIMTGTKHFYSKFFARANQEPAGNQQTYLQDGYGANIGLTTGLWMRNFHPGNTNYKSLATSFKDLFDSCNAIFNVGLGIEYVYGSERVRVESMDYFYQDEVVITLGRVNNVIRTVDADLYFSGLSFGYKKGGDYSESMGLDEPNIQNEYVTPMNKTTNKYEKISSVRADEYGMELSRRQPRELKPNEEDGNDEDLFFLDMYDNDGTWNQKEYDLRLSVPPTGIFSPDTFKSAFFTPVRALLRHAWIFGSGLQKNANSNIQYTYGEGNAELETAALPSWASGAEPYKENANLLINQLPRPKLDPQVIQFDYPVDQDLLDKITGFTEKTINGVKESVPNTYFKVQFINENGDYETGYIMSVKPNGQGVWSIQKSNENNI